MTLPELLADDDDSFAESAFAILLKRKPDATSGAGIAKDLRADKPKLQILAEIAYSAECKRVGGSIPGLTEALAEAGYTKLDHANAKEPSTQIRAIRRAEELLSISDVDQFVDGAYWLLLKRAPDVDGILNCRSRLKSGVSRVKVLHELYESDEAKACGAELPGLADTFLRAGLDIRKKPTTHNWTPVELRSGEDLLALHGGHFIENAFHHLLCRRATATEQAAYLEKLLSGDAKLAVLSEIAAATKKIPNIPGLASLLSQYRLSKMPLLGGVWRGWFGIEGDSSVERRTRASEARLFELDQRLSSVILHLESQAQAQQTTLVGVEELLRNNIAHVESLEKNLFSLAIP